MNEKFKSLYNAILKGGSEATSAGLESVRIDFAGSGGFTGSMDKVETANASFNEFKKNLNINLGNESVALTDAQIKAGFLGRTYGHFGQGSAYNNARNTMELNLTAKNDKLNVVGAEVADGIGTESLKLSELGIGSEAFSPELNMNAQHFATFINIGLAKQEDLVEMFFPTVVIDPTETGVKAIVKLTSFVNAYKRNIKDTKSPLEKMDPKPIIKNLFNRQILSEDQTKVVPVFRNDFAADLDQSLSYSTSVTGEAITSAPYLFNRDLELLKMSQTDYMLEQGIMDQTDSLLPSIVLSDLYFAFNGEGGKEQIFKVDVSRELGSAFAYIGAGHYKSLQLSFNKRPLTIVLGSDANATKLHDGAAQELDNTKVQAIQAKLPQGTNFEGYKVTFLVDISGNGNIQQGVVKLLAAAEGSIIPAHVYGPNGEEIDTSVAGELGDLILKLFEGLKLKAFNLDAYRSNTNLRTKGKTIQVDEYGQYFTCPWRSPFNVTGPISRHTGNECDFDFVQSLVTCVTAASDMHGIIELENFASALRYRALNPQDVANRYDYSFNGQLVNTYFKEKTMNLTDHVDSIMSHQRLVDVQAAMLNELRLSCLDMLIESNYLLAFNVLYKNSGKKPVVLIGCDPIVKEFLMYGNEDGKISGVNFDIVVVSSLNPALKGKMYVTLTLGEKVGDVTSIQALNFGWRLYSVSVTATIKPETTNGTAIERTMVIPRFLHKADLPIMQVYDIIGLPEVIKKVAIKTV